MLIIGFGHRARQGKDTAALALINAAPLDVRIKGYGYADALKDEVRRAISGAGSQERLIATWQEAGLMPDWVKAEQPKPRTLLQWWGTEYRRAKDNDYWVKRLMETLDRDQPEVALITDVRFHNEVAAIQRRGGKVVKVTRLTPADISVPSHPSEDVLEGFTGWDYELTATTVPELRKKAIALYKRITEGN